LFDGKMNQNNELAVLQERRKTPKMLICPCCQFASGFAAAELSHSAGKNIHLSPAGA
jgi:hypothetical protein